MEPLEKVLEAVNGDAKREGRGYLVFCPAHNDGSKQGKRSLSVTEAEDGRVLLNCFADCSKESVLDALGMEWRELYPQKNDNSPKKREVAAYDYQDEDGNLLFQSVRYEPKEFKQRQSKDKWSLEGVETVPYRLPEVKEAVEDGSLILVVEGEEDVHTLEGEGWTATTNPMGAGKWREAYSEHLRGAHAVVIPDNDPPGKKHAEEVATSLHDKAQSIRVVELPGLDESEDVRDWFGSGGTRSELLKLIDDTPEWEPPENGMSKLPNDLREQSELPSAPDIKNKGLTVSLADEITASDAFARDAGDALYRYEGGVYRPDGEDYIRARTKELLLRWDLPNKWTSYRSTEVSRYLLADAPVLWEEPPIDRINVLNGILDVGSGELHPHTTDWLSPIQIPVAYEPEATCPAWDRFIARTFPDDAAELAYELAGWLMVPDTSLKKAVLLVGETDTGKSTFLQALTSFIGGENASAIPLQKLEESRFSTSGLVGRLANISDELPSRDLVSTAVFKKTTGGGNAIEAERKHGREFSFRPFARLVFSANRPPRSSDSTEAFFNRWVVVPFNKTFGPDEKRPRTEVDAELAEPSELSGVLNRAVKSLRSVWERGGISQPESVQQTLAEFRSTTDPLSVWLQRNVVEHPKAMVAKDELLQRYGDECAKRHITPPNKTEFGLAIKREYPSIEDKQRTYNGKPKTHVYLGIGLRDHEIVTSNGDRRAEIEEALG